MTYYVVRFEQFFNGHDIADGLQSLDNRYTDFERAKKVADIWHEHFPSAKISVHEVTSNNIYGYSN